MSMGKPEDHTQIVRTLVSLNSADTVAVLLGNGNGTFTLRIRFSFPIAAAQ